MADYDTETASLIAATEARIANLVEMRSSGVLSVRHGDTMTQFQSTSDLNKAIAEEKKDLRRLKGIARQPVFVLQSSKGL